MWWLWILLLLILLVLVLVVMSRLNLLDARVTNLEQFAGRTVTLDDLKHHGLHLNTPPSSSPPSSV